MPYKIYVIDTHIVGVQVDQPEFDLFFQTSP